MSTRCHPRCRLRWARFACVSLVILLAAPAVLLAQELAQLEQDTRSPFAHPSLRRAAIDPRKFVRIVLPASSPLELVHLDYGSSHITRSEQGMLMDLDLRLIVRNRSPKPIEGLALALSYGFSTPGAGGLNAVSGIRLAPGETYAVPARMRVEIELPPRSSRARPVDLPTSVRLRLDSVLFADGSAYGPDRMRVLSTMRMNQAESARDRRYLHVLLQRVGLPRLISLLEKWARQAAGPRPGSERGNPRVLAGVAAERARALAEQADFEVVHFPDAPLEIVRARAGVYESGPESGPQSGLVDPELEVRSRAGTGIVDFQVAWLFDAASGTESRAATISGAGFGSGSGASRASASRALLLPPGGSLEWSDSTVLETGSGAPLLSGRVYLRAVEFSDGRIWVPGRAALEAAGLAGVVPPSPEMIRLLRFYQARGPQALSAELRR